MLTDDVKELAALIDQIIEAGQLEMIRETFFTVAVVAILFYAVFFLLEAIGIYTINKRLGNKAAGLAFLPGVCGYALGTAADSLKKRKPSNYCIHMLMLKCFALLVTAVYAAKSLQHMNTLYEALLNANGTETVKVLESVLAQGNTDNVYVIAYNLSNWIGFAVTFVSLLCYARILQLFRSHNGFFLLFATIFIPQVMSVYLFAKRHADLYTSLPVFRMPGSWEQHGGDGNASDSDESFPSEDPIYTPPQEPSEEEAPDSEADDRFPEEEHHGGDNGTENGNDREHDGSNGDSR
jgi:hypothetical protein